MSAHRHTRLNESLKELCWLSCFIVLYGCLWWSGMLNAPSEMVVPSEFRSLPRMTGTELENELRSQSNRVQEIIFFKGLNSVAVLYPWFNEHRLVTPVDDAEIHGLALKGDYIISVIDAEQSKPVLGIPGYAGLFALMVWIWVFLCCTPAQWQFNRLDHVLLYLSEFTSAFAVSRNWRKSRFYTILWLAGVMLLAVCFERRAFNRESVPELPPEFSNATRSQPWAMERFLQTSPDQVDRCIAIPEANAVVVMVRSTPVIPSVVEFSDDEVGRENLDSFVRFLQKKNVSTHVTAPVRNKNWWRTVTPLGMVCFSTSFAIAICGGISLLSWLPRWRDAETAAEEARRLERLRKMD